MSALRLLLAVAFLGLCVHYWHAWREEKALQAIASPNGFLPVPMPTNTPPNTVLIFAPLNCPREGAQRAEALSQKLNELGIKNIKTASYAAATFENTEENLASYKRLNVVMTGEIPIALVNGMGKANPTIDELVAEYNSTQP